jgi:hypothetical protein
MSTYILIESGTDRILGVTEAADPVSACIEVSRRSGNPTSRVLYARSDPIRDMGIGSPTNSWGSSMIRWHGRCSDWTPSNTDGWSQ